MLACRSYLKQYTKHHNGLAVHSHELHILNRQRALMDGKVYEQNLWHREQQSYSDWVSWMGCHVHATLTTAKLICYSWSPHCMQAIILHAYRRLLQMPIRQCDNSTSANSQRCAWQTIDTQQMWSSCRSPDILLRPRCGKIWPKRSFQDAQATSRNRTWVTCTQSKYRTTKPMSLHVSGAKTCLHVLLSSCYLFIATWLWCDRCQFWLAGHSILITEVYFRVHKRVRA